MTVTQEIFWLLKRKKIIFFILSTGLCWVSLKVHWVYEIIYVTKKLLWGLSKCKAESCTLAEPSR